MTAQELMRDLCACESQPLDVCLMYIADRCYDLRLSNGTRVLDSGDMKQFLVECAHYLHPPIPPSGELKAIA